MLRLFKQYYPIRNVFFVMGEFFFIYFSVYAASLILLGPECSLTDQWLWLKIFLISFACMICLYYNDLYDLNLIASFGELAIRLVQALGAAAILLGVIYFLFPQAIIGQGIFILSIVLIVLLIISWRFLYKAILDRGYFNQKIILLGSGQLAKNIVQEIVTKKDCGYQVTMQFMSTTDSPEPVDSSHSKISTLIKNGYEGICEAAKEMKIEKIVVAMMEKRGAMPIQELLRCRVNGIEVLEGNSFYEMLTGKLIVEQIQPGWLIFTDGFHKPLFQRTIKRFIDLVLSLLLLILLLPLILIIAAAIKIDSRGSVVFSQDRVGQDKSIYRVHKFRSMIDGAEKSSGPVWAKDEDPRITRVGRLLRKLRLDEIPQLWNVLKGEMSFVGPRPERKHFVDQLEKTIPYYRERFTVHPGITGWAQVSYGYGASVEDAIEKLNYDLFYIKNLSIWMDLLIIFKTIKIVLFARGR